METKEKTYTMAELKELKEVLSEASTRNPGTITLTVPELEKLFEASAPKTTNNYHYECKAEAMYSRANCEEQNISGHEK